MYTSSVHEHKSVSMRYKSIQYESIHMRYNNISMLTSIRVGVGFQCRSSTSAAISTNTPPALSSPPPSSLLARLEECAAACSREEIRTWSCRKDHDGVHAAQKKQKKHAPHPVSPLRYDSRSCGAVRSRCSTRHSQAATAGSNRRQQPQAVTAGSNRRHKTPSCTTLACPARLAIT